jgi:hypothetical protein
MHAVSQMTFPAPQHTRLWIVWIPAETARDPFVDVRPLIPPGFGIVCDPAPASLTATLRPLEDDRPALRPRQASLPLLLPSFRLGIEHQTFSIASAASRSLSACSQLSQNTSRIAPDRR